MCMYCFVADGFFDDKHPPVWPTPLPYVPLVPVPKTPPEPDYTGWPVDRLKELLDVLQKIKKLEDDMKGCPCEPAKADYIQMLKDRIKSLEDGFDICPSCKRLYKKPAASHHTKVQCLEQQLMDAKADAFRITML